MDEFFAFLGSPGQTILGIFIGGVMVIVGQTLNSRAATKSATMAVEASQKSTDANLEIARGAARTQMKAALVDSTLEAYEAFHDRMAEWDTSMRDELALGHGEVSSRDEYAGFVLAEDWAATGLLGKLTAVSTGQLPLQAAAVYWAGLDALRAHERNFFTSKENNQDQKFDAEQARISALEAFRERLADLPTQLREYLEIDQPQQ